MLKVAERRKRVPEQVKMLLDDALRRQAALADRIEFEQGEDEGANISEEIEGGRFFLFEWRMLRCSVADLLTFGCLCLHSEIGETRSCHSGIHLQSRIAEWSEEGMSTAHVQAGCYFIWKVSFLTSCHCFSYSYHRRCRPTLPGLTERKLLLTRPCHEETPWI